MSLLAEPTSPRAAPLEASAAYLIVDIGEKRHAGPILSRVLIGRRASNHIVIADPAIARIHAWIIRCGDDHVLCDTGSRAGTLVNDRRVEGRHTLRPGDRLRIGSATIHYTTDLAAIAGVDPLDLSDRPIAATRPEDGQFVDCACGAPLWVPWDFAGKMGQCRYCRQTVFVQTKLAVVSLPPQRSVPRADASPAVSVCGICQSPITPGERDHACPSCGIPFHADCWTENRGCSSYGCSQVNSLDSPAEQSPPPGEALSDASTESAAPPLPWEFLILAGAVIGSLVGAWTFGLPALGAAIAAGMGLRKTSPHRSVLFVALIFAALGAVGGIGVSYFWWIASKHAAIAHS